MKVRGVILGIRAPYRADDHGVVRSALLEGGPVLLTVICGACGGGRRAHLGLVFESSLGPVATFEVVLIPKACSNMASQAQALRDWGWRQRGEPDSLQRGYLLDEWHDDLDGPADIYCPAHGLKIVTFAQIRDAIETRPRSRKPGALVV